MVKCTFLAVLLGGAALAGDAAAQPILGSSTRFDLADSVQVDRADANVVAQLQRASACLTDHQWDQAVETLRQAAESSPGKLVTATPQRWITVREACQMRLAALPPEALSLYRGRVDSMAQRWYEEGIRTRDRGLLSNVVRQAFASSWGDKALLALGELDLEAGDFSEARWCWERILPAPKAEKGQELVNWPGFPDSAIDPAAVRARLVLVSILEGCRQRARDELSAFVKMHGEARGRLQGREVVYAKVLAQLLEQSVQWPQDAPSGDWPTFAGNASRNAATGELTDAASVAWRLPLAPPAVYGGPRRELADDGTTPLSCYPVSTGTNLFLADQRQIMAVRADDGRPAWGGRNPVIYRAVPDSPFEFSRGGIESMGGVPRNSLTIADDRLYARMGPAATSWPQGMLGERMAASLGGYLVCLDLASEGKLVWKTSAGEGWAMEGAPLAAGGRVYAVMRRNDIRPQVHVACFDAPTGKLRWRQFIAAAETPGRGAMFECSHDLLTLAGETLYVNTNLGAVAALSASDGALAWVTLYPRDRQGDLLHLAPHWRRDMNPCVFDHGTLLVAPSDTARLLALDAATGQFLWQSGAEMEDVLHLLGTTNDHLLASGRRLYWINLRGPNAGRIAHYRPETEEKLGYGRGVLTATKVLWPSRRRLYVFDRITAEEKKSVDLAACGASGGNIMVVDGRLTIATATELIGISPKPIQREIKTELTGDIGSH